MSAIMTDTLTKEGLLTGSSRRYQAIDVLRGLTIALMVVVNTPGSWETIYAPFRHAAWHGATITDLVFPTFLFVVGNAMSFSMMKYRKLGNKSLLQKIFKRTALIFLLGLLLTLFPFVTWSEGGIEFKNFADTRIMGVLQRIALCYCIAALAIHYFSKKGVVIFSLVLLLFYWAVMYFFGDQPDPYSLKGNAALKFDLLLLPAKNLYHGFGIPFDPEGLLSTLPAVVNVIAGYFAGMFIRKNGNNMATVWRLILVGLAFLAVSMLWDIYFPINKPIWTSSYVLFATGWDLFALAALIAIIEVAGIKGWASFFEVFGKNPLFIYILSGLIIKTLSFIPVGETSLSGWIYQNLFLTWAEGKNASLLFAVFYMLLLWLIGFWMDKKRIYIKV